MCAKSAVKGNHLSSSGNSQANALDLLVRNIINGHVNTAEVVKVVKTECSGADSASGYVDVVPLVTQTDGNANIIAPVTLYRLPYFRFHGGIAAVVIDPQPGDTGLAVYAKRDSSMVRQGGDLESVQPGSFRSFDQADGFYIGGFLNKKPEIWLELAQNKTAILHAPEKVQIEAKSCVINASEKSVVNTRTATVKASSSVTIDSPKTMCTGSMTVAKDLSWGGFGSGPGGGPALFKCGIVNQSGGITNNGGLLNSGGNINSNGVVLETHLHDGVENGGSFTGAPR